MNRRYFLMSSAAAAPRRRSGRKSPNDTVRVAVVGCGGRGNSHMSAWTSMPNVELAGLVDVDDSHSERYIGALQKSGKKAAPTFRDIRKVLDDKNIDAVSIASPNHWHTLQTIWACQAGKDVYVEKPCSHNVFESKQIVAAARKYDRMVQMGSQSRSSPALQEAVQKMQRRRIRRDLHGARIVFQGARHDREDPGRGGSARRRLRYVDRAGAAAPVHEEPVPLQLALVLGYRQRRPGQPGNPRSGHLALGPGRDPSDQGERDGRQVHVRRRSGDAQHHHAPTSSTSAASPR